jgi:predicted nucleic acid-binding protein
VTLVVDASVAAKWIVPEPDSAAAAALREQNVALIAPSLIAAEIGNTLWKAARRGNIEQTEAISGIRAALLWFESLIPIEELRVRALELAFDLKHPIYDCFYLALAERERCPLITADSRLIAAARAMKGVELRLL